MIYILNKPHPGKKDFLTLRGVSPVVRNFGIAGDRIVFQITLAGETREYHEKDKAQAFLNGIQFALAKAGYILGEEKL